MEYPSFLAPGTDSAPFLNAMFGIFNRAMAPPGAPAGPIGPLAFSMPGYQIPFQQASFMPFMPSTGIQWPTPASIQQSPDIRRPSPSLAHSMTEKRAPQMARSRMASSMSRHSEDHSTERLVQQEFGLALQSASVPELVLTPQDTSMPQDISTQSVPPAPAMLLGKQRGPDYDLEEADVLRRKAQRLRERLFYDDFDTDGHDDVDPYVEQ